MNILCVIPTRGGSKGFKNKNIIPLSGKPLIGYTIEVALASRMINKIVVSTDDKKIAEVASRDGIQVIKGPRRYSIDSSPIEHPIKDEEEYILGLGEQGEKVRINFTSFSDGELVRIREEIIGELNTWNKFKHPESR